MRKIKFISKISLMVTLAITVCLVVVSFWGDAIATVGVPDSEVIAAQQAFLDNVTIEGLFGYTYLLVILSIGSIIVFTVLELLTNPRTLVYAASVLVAFVALIWICYLMVDHTESIEEIVSGVGLLTTYSVMGIALCSIVVTEVLNSFK